MVKFHFFACSCPDLPTPFVEEAIFTPIYASAPFIEYQLTIETWVYFWALYSVPCISVSVLKAVPDCFDYGSLAIYFAVRYCDPSYFFLLSKYCCSYSESFIVSYKILKCLFYVCEICHWYFNRDFIESINCFG